MRIAVLYTKSTEENSAEVSNDLNCMGSNVINALKAFGHDVVPYDVNEQTFDKLRNDNVDFAFNVCERFNGQSFFEPHVASMLELLNIPYTGSGPLTLALCLNKLRVKEILMHHGIPTPKYQVFYSKNKKLNDDLKFPLFVKPVGNHNSIGITNESVVKNEEELRKRVSYILRTYNQPALVEEYIDGTDVDAGILGNSRNAISLPVIYIEYDNLPNGINPIYSYDAKWNKESQIYKRTCYIYYGDENDDQRFSKSVEQKIKRVAHDTYKILGCRDYGRVDIRVSTEGMPYVLEMNPNPGISADDSLPFVAESIGISYYEMINRILWAALDRYNMLDKLEHIPPKLEINSTKELLRPVIDND